MIVDCFPFFNELELLELRLRTLEAVVDRFVLVEATTTQSGLAKPLSFAEHRERFARWNDRIVHLIDRQPPSSDARANEWRQRDVLATALADLAPDDVVLMSDCDEIPDPARLGIRPRPGELLAFEQLISLYFANFRENAPWLGTRAFRAGDFPRWGSMHAIRGVTRGATIVPHGGWHLTWLGDREFVRTKLVATADTEFGIPYFRDPARVDELLRSGRSIVDTASALRWVPLDETFPAPLRADPERWRAFLCDRPADDPGVPARAHAHGLFTYAGSAADAIAVVADDAEPWTTLGPARFGARFAGVVARYEELGGALHGAHAPCIVVDGFERSRPAALLAAVRGPYPAATIVAACANARSFDQVSAVVAGAAFPPGEALGLVDLERLFADGGYALERCDRVPKPGFWLELRIVPEHLGLKLGRVRIDGVHRDKIADLTASAFVAVARALS